MTAQEGAIRHCPACGEGAILLVMKDGRQMPYRDMPALLVPCVVAIPTCNHCGSEWIDLHTAKALDEALESAYASVEVSS